MNSPFARGFNRADLYTGSLVAAAQILSDPASAVAVLNAVQEGVAEHFEGTLVTPETIVFTSANYCFVCVKGTGSWAQWVFDFLGSGQVPTLGIPGQVAAYFGLTALTISTRIAASVIAAGTSKRLVFIGHSLGAAVCQCLAAIFTPAAAKGLGVYCFGSPRVGDPVFRAGIGANVLRVQTTLDPICSLPPILWAGTGSNFPIPGPAPFATYSHAGTAQTLDEDGQLRDGSELISLPDVVKQLIRLTAPSHYAQEYARRLRLGLAAEDLTPQATGYVRPSVLDLVYRDLTGNDPIGATFMASPTFGKVELFYNYFGKGISERFYSALPADLIRTTIIPRYMQYRMALANPNFQFVYARISNPLFPRLVDFASAQTVSPRRGQATGLGASPRLALLLRMKLVNGHDARIFLHGFPQTLLSGNDLNIPSSYNAQITSFVAQLGGSVAANYQGALSHTLIDKKYISAIVPVANGRGATITPVGGTARVAGDVINIGGANALMVGMKGRKVITYVATDGSTFRVGGARPIGNYTGTDAYFYPVTYLYSQPLRGEIERLTTHKVGRPFGEPAGRARNLLPTR